MLTILYAFIACSPAKKMYLNPYFEGQIMYKNEYIIKTSNIDSARLNKIFGKTANLAFKEGNYLEVYDDGFMLEQTL